MANQAALMAGQRGSNANVGLLSRQAAQQGANTQQQSAGQAATLQANQSLNAINSAGQLATNQANQQANALNSLNSSAQGEQGQILNAIQGQNSADIQNQASVNAANAGIAGATQQGQNGLLGGLVGGAATALTSVAKAQGGVVHKYADGSAYVNNGQSDDGSDPFAGTSAAAGNTVMPVNGQMPMAADPQQAGFVQTPQAQAAQISPAMKTTGSIPVVQPAAPQAATPLNTPAKPGKVAQALKTLGTSLGGQQAGAKGSQPTGTFAAGEGLGKLGVALGKALFAPSQPGAGSGAQNASYYTSDNTNAPTPSIDASNTSNQLAAARGGKVPSLVSPGERYLKPKEAREAAMGKKDPMKAGEKIPGTPKVKGAVNSYANDTVKKNLDEGGIVIPRSITQGSNAHWESMKFVRAAMAKQTGKLK